MGNRISLIRNKRPLVHCLTNYVTVNDCANILLAVGASPIMAHHISEVCEVTSHADALLCNLGATEYYDAMKLSCDAATKQGIPIIVDPVGVSGIGFRREFFFELAAASKFSCIRGNASEIMALYLNTFTSAGVDAGSADANSGASLADTCIGLSKKFGCVVVASGACDIVADGDRVLKISGGSSRMKNITGAGCMSSAIVAGMLAATAGDERFEVVVAGDERFEAVVDACRLMNICAKQAADECDELNLGSQSFRIKLIDKVSLLTELK